MPVVIISIILLYFNKNFVFLIVIVLSEIQDKKFSYRFDKAIFGLYDEYPINLTIKGEEKISKYQKYLLDVNEYNLYKYPPEDIYINFLHKEDFFFIDDENTRMYDKGCL